MLLRILFVLILAGFQLPGIAATFVVNDLGDDPDANPGDGICDIPVGGPARCTLRAAIMEANTTPVVDFVEFGLGLIVINISGTPLPTIIAGLWIDATTAPGYNGAADDTIDAPPSVYIDGSALTGSTADGLRAVNTDGIRVLGLGIVNFPDNGIELINGEPAVIDSNWIGVSRTGGVAGNGGAGVYLDNYDRAQVGRDLDSSPTVWRGNVISNNDEDGIFLILSEDAEIAGNLIGGDPLGTSSFGNGGHGVRLIGPNNRVGGALNDDNRGNTIQHNAGSGILSETGGQRIYSNTIQFNQAGGILLNGANNQIGFATPAQGNVITENAGHGIHIGSLFASSGNLVRHGLIAANTGRGIQISGGANNVIRDTSLALNQNDAIRADASTTQIFANEIGLLNNGLLGNSANGVVLGGNGNQLSGNLIGGLDDDGVDVVSGVGNLIQNNQIGMRSNGADIGNLSAGVRVRAGAADTLIENNFLGHSFDGISLEGGGIDVCGNHIGVGAEEQPAGNAAEGVRIDGSGNRVGDSANGCAANVIGFNLSDGVQISGDANIVRNNTVGGIPFVDLGNGNAGVFLANGADLNEIADNILYNNGNDGIRVAAGAGTRNRFDGNNFGSNGDLFIDLGDDGITANDAGDSDSGANNLQNFPEITSLASVNGRLEISYRVDSGTTASTYPLTVDFHVVAGGNQNIYRIHRDSYNQSPGSSRTILIDPPFASSQISAMVIDLEGNSSELSPPQAYFVEPPSDQIFNDRFELP
jgi:CSLREA domain-containing protein